jgi:formylglycine-generating enzyme required for sulfatase activity
LAGLSFRTIVIGHWPSVLGREPCAARSSASEAEWEYAARAGTTTRFSFGNNDAELCGHSNGADRTFKQTYKAWLGVANCVDNYVRAAPVGVFAANRFGLHDMLGNVGEWVEDCWHDSYNGAPSDGSAWTAGDCTRRVVRGGSWFNLPGGSRSAIRFRGITHERHSLYGLRVARTL